MEHDSEQLSSGTADWLPADFDGSPIAAFAIDLAHTVVRWNKACESMTGMAADKIVGTGNHWQPYYVQPQKVLADFVMLDRPADVAEAFAGFRFRSVPLVPGAYEVEDFFPHLGESGRWIAFSAAPLRDGQGRIVGAVQTMHDITETRLAEESLHAAQVRVERFAGKRSEMLAQASGHAGNQQGDSATSLEKGMSAETIRASNDMPATADTAAVPVQGGLSSKTDASTTPALSAFFDGSPVPAFAIDANHVVTHWNQACERTIGVAASRMIGTRNQWAPFYPKERPVLADLIVSGAVEEMVESYYHGKFRRSPIIPGAFEAEDFFPNMGESGRWLFFSAAPLRDASGRVIGAIETLQDVTKRKLAERDLHKVQVDLEHLVAKRTAQLAQANRTLEDDIRRREEAEAELLRRNAELTDLNKKLSMAQEQLMQSEKLASIGQLAAGVAHEINNPIGYIFSNFGALEQYLSGLLEMLEAYEEVEHLIDDEATLARLKSLRERVEFDYLKGDLPYLMEESREGLIRVRKIVQDLKDFSRVDSHLQWQWADVHQGIDSTLNIVNNEIKYKADVIKEYGVLPEIECLPSQINQVVMNMVVNAAQAIGEERGRIVIRTGSDGSHVWIEFEDNGCGMTKETMSRIFDPFYTTKPVGKGTGLGLSLSYGIVQKHQGHIDVRSEVGRGSTFRVVLPVRHAAA
ncbi:ATP-binding protein [Noviherbaspirillum sp. ST9]|uniref:ATP-binding protein n=1 Tax=Noviherbaspirillum sp. ST9 TaxID=3401606 RepID=UPI003B58A737